MMTSWGKMLDWKERVFWHLMEAIQEKTMDIFCTPLSPPTATFYSWMVATLFKHKIVWAVQLIRWWCSQWWFWLELEKVRIPLLLTMQWPLEPWWGDLGYYWPAPSLLIFSKSILIFRVLPWFQYLLFDSSDVDFISINNQQMLLANLRRLEKSIGTDCTHSYSFVSCFQKVVNSAGCSPILKHCSPILKGTGFVES